jgi:autotransporter-associated beta strand protein
LIAAAAASAVIGTLSTAAWAANNNLYWGGGTSAISNGTPPAGGTGNWDLTTKNWSQDASLVTTYQLWPAAGSTYTANFGNTAGTVTLDNTGVQADSLIFTTTGYTLAGSTTNNLTLIGQLPPSIVDGSGISTLITAPISGNEGLTTAGSGTLTLAATNTYIGATTIGSGSTLSLDFSQATSPATNIISSTPGNGLNGLMFSGGTLSLTGLSGGTNSQAFNNVLLLPGSSVLTTNQNGATSLNVSAGAFTRLVGGTIDFATLPTSGNISTTSANNLGGGNAAFGILGGWATVGGSNWATVSSGNIVAFSNYSTTAALGTTLANYANVDVDVTNSAGTLSGAIAPNSIRFNTAGAEILTLATGNNSLVSGGILITSNVGANASVITGGTLQGKSGTDLVVIQNNTASTLAINSIIADNSSATGLTKSGAGTLILGGADTYTGLTVINAGAIQFATGGSAAASTFVENVNGGVTFGTATAVSLGGLMGSGNINLTNSAPAAVTLSVGNNNTNTLYSGVLSGNTGAGGALTKIGTGILTLTGANTYTGATTISAGTLQLGDGLTTNGSIAGNSIVDTAALIFANPNALTYTGVISGTAGTVTKIGAGTLTLIGTNTYTGATSVNAGTLALDFSQTGQPLTNIISSSSALSLGGGTLALTGKSGATNSQAFAGVTINPGGSAITASQNGATSLSANLGYIVRQFGGGTVDFTLPGTGSIATTAVTSNGILGGWATVGGSNWATVSGGNIVALSSYTNDAWAAGNNTTVTTSSAISSGTTNSLQFNTAAANTLTLTGTNVVTSGGILVSSAVGANASTITGGTLEGAAGRDLIVNQFDTGGTIAINSTIADNTTGTALTKSGPGTLSLGGANSFTGNTYVNAGVLQLSNANAVQNSTVVENLNNSLTFGAGIGTFNVGGLSGAGNLALTDTASSPVTLSVGGDNASTIYSGLLSGSGALTKVGSGMLSLGNTGVQSFSGNVTVSGGYLKTAGSIGTGTVNLSGGTLWLAGLSGNYFLNNPVNVTSNSLIVLDSVSNISSGVVGFGRTQNFGNLALNAPFLEVSSTSNTNSGTAGITFGNVTLGSDSMLMLDGSTSASGSVPTALGTGSITGNHNFTVASQSGATVTVNGNIGTAGDTATLNKYGAGTLVVNNGAIGSGGQVNVTGGTLQLAGSSTAFNVSNFVVNGGATLQLGTNGVTQIAQIASTANVTLNGGTLYGASPATLGVAPFGYVTAANSLIIGPGESSFSGVGASGTGTHVLQFNSFSRSVGGVFYAGPLENNFTTSDALFFGNYATYGNGQNNSANPANLPMTNSLIVGVLWNGDFATVNNSPAALGSNPGATFPPIVISNITSFDYTGGPTGNPQYGNYAALSLPEVGSLAPNDGTSTVLEQYSGSIYLSGNTNVNAINISPNSNPGAGAVTAMTGELLASTIDGNGGGNFPIRITNGTLTSSGTELFLLNSTSNSAWGISASITGTASLVHGGSSSSAGAQVYLSGENTYSGQTYLDSPNAVNILTERQLGAQPSTLVTNSIELSNGSTLAFASNVVPTLSPLRGITLNGGTSTISFGNYTNIPSSVSPNVVLASPITGNGGITFSNNNFNSETITGANTYDGQTSIGGGNLSLNYETINNIGSGTASSFGSPTNAYNGRLVFNSANNNGTFNYVGIGNASTDREIDLYNTTAQNIGATGTGSLNLNGNILVPNGGGTSSDAVSFSGSSIGVLNGNIISTLPGNSIPFKVTVGGNILNMWTFNGSNAYDGAFTVSTNATAQFTTIGTVGSGPSSLGAPTTVTNGTVLLSNTNGGGVLRFIGNTSQYTDRAITNSGTNSLEASGTNGASLTWAGPITIGTTTLVLGGSGMGTVPTALVGTTGGLTKTGQGTWTLNPASAEPYTGTTTVNGGTLVLDYSNLATATNLLASTSPLTLGGGTLSMLAKSGGATAQTVGAFKTSNNTGSQLILNGNSGSGVSLTTTGTVTRGGGSTLSINQSGTTTLTLGTLTLTNTNGLLPWATINGADFAKGVAAGGAVTVFNTYTGALPATGGALTDDDTLSGSPTQTGSTSFAALKITGSGALTLGTYNLGTSNNNPVAILYDGTGGNSYSINSSTGAIGSNGNELITHVNNGTLTFNAPIGTTGGAFTKAGNGTLVLGGADTFTGVTNVNFGTLQPGSTTGLSPNSVLNIALSGSGGTGGVTAGVNTATVALSGFNSNVAGLAGNGILTNTSATPVTLTIGSSTAPLSSGYVQTFDGLLQDGTGGGALSIVKSGTLEQVLTGAVGNTTSGWNNSYSGSLTIADGNLDSPFINSVGANGPLGTSSTAIVMGSTSHTGILGYSGVNGTTNRNFTVAAGGGAGFDVTSDTNSLASAAQALFGSTLNLSGNFNGSGPTLKVGPGNLILSGNNSNYTGNYIVTGGLLQFANNTTAIGTGSTITLRDGGVVSVTSAATDLTGGLTQAFLNRVAVAADSVGVVALGANSNSNLSFASSNLSNASLGAAIPVTYTGTLTPNGTTYRLGGGGPESSITLPNANQLTGANSLVVSPGGSSNSTGTSSPATVIFGDIQNYSGPTTIMGGNSLTFLSNGTAVTATVGNASLTLAGANASIPNSPVTINNGGILRLVESPNDVNKLGTQTLTLNGGTLEQDTDGSSQWSYGQTISSVALNRGASTVYVNAASSGQSNVLTISGLTRTAGATLNIGSNLNTTTDQVVLSGAPTLPAAWMFVNSADYATLSGGNVVALAAAATTADTTWTSSLDTSDTTATITLSAANRALHTLRVTGTAAITFGADNLAINGILAAGGAVTIGAATDTGAVTAPNGGGEIDVAPLGNSATILEKIADPISGGGTTTLVVSSIKGVTLGSATAPTAASTYTGGIVLNQGTLTVASLNSLPASTAGITINGGFLNVTGGTANGLLGGTVWSNPITINADAAFQHTNTSTYAGTLTLANGANLFLQANGNSTTADLFSGNIVGTGNIYYVGSAASYRTIAGATANTYTGNTYLYGDESNANAGGLTVTFSKNNSGAAVVAIPGDLYLGRTGITNSSATMNPDKAVMGYNTDQFGASSTIYFGGGHGDGAGDLQIAGTTTQVVVGLQSLMPGDGLIENGANASAGVLTVNVPASVTRTYSGAIVNNGLASNATGTLSLVFNGLGTQVLSGVNNVYSGSTNVAAGTLVAGATNALSPNSAVNVSGGTLDVSGYGQTIPSLNVSAGTLNIGLGNVLTVTGAASFGGTLNISSGTVGTLPETLISYGSDTGSSTFATTLNVPTGDKLVYGTNALVLVTSGPANLTWNNAGGTGDGVTWDTTNANWNNGTGVVAYSNNSNTSTGDNVTFNDTNNGHYNVTINNSGGSVSPTAVTFAATGNYNISGFTAGVGISGSGSVTLTGPGTVTMNASNAYLGGTNISNGRLVLATAGAFPGNSGNGTPLTVGASGVLQIAVHTGSTSYEPIVNSLTNNGVIDITNNEMLFTGSGAYPTISSEVAAAYNPSTGTWNTVGNGLITSSTVGGLTTVGVAQVSGGVEVKATYFGDALLTGSVTSADYTAIDNGFLNTLTGWQNGDFNYDGVVNGSDYTLIDNAFNMQGANLSSEIAAPTALIAGGSGVASAVPEPTTLGLLGLGALGLLGRRNRKRN